MGEENCKIIFFIFAEPERQGVSRFSQSLFDLRFSSENDFRTLADYYSKSLASLAVGFLRILCPYLVSPNLYVVKSSEILNANIRSRQRNGA